MKYVGMILLLCCQVLHGQNWQEWTRQKQTQQRYLAQQIIALRAFAGTVKEGYTLARTGLTTIRRIKDRDLSLHTDFVDRLGSVNPHIKGYSRVAGIISLQIKIVKTLQECLSGAREAEQLTVSELYHCAQVTDNVLHASLANLDMLFTLLSKDSLQLTDDQRLQRIDALYADMQQIQSFCSAYSEELALLTVHRLRERYELKLSQKLNGIK